MQRHHLISAVPKHGAHLYILCPWVEEMLESPMRWLPFGRICLPKESPSGNMSTTKLNEQESQLGRVRTKESNLADEFNVALHLRNAGSSENSSITVFVNSGMLEPSSLVYFFTHSTETKRGKTIMHQLFSELMLQEWTSV